MIDLIITGVILYLSSEASGFTSYFGFAPTDMAGAANSERITLISAVQGAAAESSMQGRTITVEAVVVGDFQGAAGLGGFYLQEEDGDVDENMRTSEGLFVFEGDLYVDVTVGNRVQVTGTVEERFDALTALVNITNLTILQPDAPLPTPATINFPVASDAALEAVEGMLVTIPTTLYVTEYFEYGRFGQVVLSSNGPGNAPGTDGRLDQFTQFNAPNAAEFAAYQRSLAARKLILDDGRLSPNPSVLPFARGAQPMSADNPLRGGDTISNLTGVLSFDFGTYRIQSNQGVDFQPTNPRSDMPDEVGGSLKVASLNVLNFFTTLDQGENARSGPRGQNPRGANSPDEFNRQLTKLVTAISRMDADIVGLVELENEFRTDTNGDGKFALGVLVDALNAQMGAGTYAFISPDTPFVDTSDVISVGAIYQPETVKIAAGTSIETLTDEDLPILNANLSEAERIEAPLFNGPNTNRAGLAVTFEELSSGEVFTLSVNHFKSKGKRSGVNVAAENANANDGQGHFNGTRTRGALALAAWLASDPTGSNDGDFLIVGDLNAYAQEDPMVALKEAGYTNLATMFLGNQAYSYVFDGQFGTLDYALANDSLVSQITGTTEWHINADEPSVIDYNLESEQTAALFDGQTPFRTSDHDPIIVGLDLGR
ncbi:MAG: ExeM/NucH family extracellular endonuclease [Cyanobacteria bacterium P01_D01_bin.105]